MILLDTHALVWTVADPKRLSAPALAAIRKARKEDGLAVSAITLWELAALLARGRIQAYGTLEASLELLTEGVTVNRLPPKSRLWRRSFPKITRATLPTGLSAPPREPKGFNWLLATNSFVRVTSCRPFGDAEQWWHRHSCLCILRLAQPGVAVPLALWSQSQILARYLRADLAQHQVRQCSDEGRENRSGLPWFQIVECRGISAISRASILISCRVSTWSETKAMGTTSTRSAPLAVISCKVSWMKGWSQRPGPERLW